MANDWLQRLGRLVGEKRVWKALGLYPPYLGAGVKVTSVSDDLRSIAVELRLHVWNRNYVGTQFGGSLYSMCDPFFMLILMRALGPEYVVWDKSAGIDFLKPGRGRVRAVIEVPAARVEAIRAEVAEKGKSLPVFEASILGEAGEEVARVKKVLHVRKVKEA
ncbi:MAG: DUF4442 domain-containing protein [Myxococcaceae bacterium]